MNDNSMPDGMKEIHMLRIRDGWWVPEETDGPHPAYVSFRQYQGPPGQEIRISPTKEGGPELVLTGEEFVAITRWCVAQGLNLGMAPVADTAPPAAPTPEPEIDRSCLDDRDWLYHNYVTMGHSTTAIGKMVGVSNTTVCARLKKLGIQARPRHGGKPSVPQNPPESQAE